MTHTTIPLVPIGKRPRHYAAEIIALPSKEQRSEALALVPAVFREWVRDYVTDHFKKLHFLRIHHARHSRQYYVR